MAAKLFFPPLLHTHSITGGKKRTSKREVEDSGSKPVRTRKDKKSKKEAAKPVKYRAPPCFCYVRGY